MSKRSERVSESRYDGNSHRNCVVPIKQNRGLNCRESLCDSLVAMKVREFCDKTSVKFRGDNADKPNLQKLSTKRATS